MLNAKCEYCGTYGDLGKCVSCGAPNAPAEVVSFEVTRDAVDITSFGDTQSHFLAGPFHLAVTHRGAIQLDRAHRRWKA